MFFLSGLLAFLYALTPWSKLPYEGPGDQPEHPIAVGEQAIAQHLYPEINRLMPGTWAHVGCRNLIGIEALEIYLRFETEDVKEMEKLCFQALDAATKGLKTCKKLYNYTNHSPDSPDLIRIECLTEKGGYIKSGIFKSAFYPPGELLSPHAKNIKENKQLQKVVTDIVDPLGSYIEDGLRYYFTHIEPNIKALGLDLWVRMPQVGSKEDHIALYREKYAQLKQQLERLYPGHFLMLRLVCLQNGKSGYSIQNIRNHLFVSEHVYDELKKSRECLWEWRINALDDLVPEHLHREFYK